jgi:hypothetical protein
MDILINGESLGLTNNAGFGGFTDFVIESGFVAGLNTLDFVLYNAPTGANPAGLRVEMTGSVELPNEAPTVRVQPIGAMLGEGDFYTFSVTADGTPPLSYQWKRGTQDVPGATSNVLELFAATPEDSGDYTVVVTNATGSVTSAVAKLQVLPFVTDVPLPATGVDATGTLLENLALDTHYRIVVNPDSDYDPANPEQAYAIDEFLWPIVAGPWLASGPDSRWIGPRPDVGAAAGGDYSYRLTFNVTGRDVSQMLLRGEWSSDNAGVDIRVNGVSTGQTNSGNFGALGPFSVDRGFINGTNTVDFVVNNAGAGPTGLRVQNLSLFSPVGSAPGAPRLVGQPQGKNALVGDRVSLTVLADGAAPLAYQWRKDGEPITGATAATYTIDSVQIANQGAYTVVVSNAQGTATSETAQVRVLFPVPGFFNTGVDALGVPLNDLDVDPHYSLIANPHDPAVTDALAMTGLPSPPWVANSGTSRWIGPVPDTNAAEGDYTYRLTVDLTGFDPSSIEVTGEFATDNSGIDILVNGVASGVINTTQFSAYTPFRLTNGFKTGANTIDFIVNNAPASNNPTGLRVENMRAGGLPAAAVPVLTITRSSATEVTLSWPDPSAGWALFTSPDLKPGTWTSVAQPPVVAGGSKSVTLAIANLSYFRLQLP